MLAGPARSHGNPAQEVGRISWVHGAGVDSVDRGPDCSLLGAMGGMGQGAVESTAAGDCIGAWTTWLWPWTANGRGCRDTGRQDRRFIHVQRALSDRRCLSPSFLLSHLLPHICETAPVLGTKSTPLLSASAIATGQPWPLPHACFPPPPITHRAIPGSAKTASTPPTPPL